MRKRAEGGANAPRAALNISAIHHATVSARTDFDPDSEFPESGSVGGAFNLVHELGQNPTIYPDNLGVLLPAGSMLTWRLHTHANGKETQVRVDLGFKLHPKGFKPKYVVMGAGGTGSLANHDLDIPAGDDNVQFDSYMVLSKPVKFVTFEPHMHASGKRMCLQAILPSGARQTLNCAGYDHNWVKAYVYEDDAAPLLPAGTILHGIGWYDNSAKNPRNAEPRNWKGFGNRSIEDMMFSLGKYVSLTEEDYKAELAARQVEAAAWHQPLISPQEWGRRHEETCSQAGRRLGAGGAGAGSFGSADADRRPGPAARSRYSRGQDVAPDFQGWEPNPDGSFDMVFGYLNRNYEEHVHVPIGPNNRFDPGGPDRGQPTYFLPRRNRDIFRVRVPADFGEKELVWTADRPREDHEGVRHPQARLRPRRAGQVPQQQRHFHGRESRTEQGSRRHDRGRRAADRHGRRAARADGSSRATTGSLPHGRRPGGRSGSRRPWVCAWPGSSTEVLATL